MVQVACMALTKVLHWKNTDAWTEVQALARCVTPRRVKDQTGEECWWVIHSITSLTLGPTVEEQGVLRRSERSESR